MSISRQRAGATLAIVVAALVLMATWLPGSARASVGAVVLSGRVTDDAGVPLRMVRVELHRDEGERYPWEFRTAALTDDQGYWRIETGEGRHYLEAEDPFYLHEYRTVYYPDTFDRAQALRMDLKPDQSYTADFTMTSAFATGPSKTAVDTSSRAAVTAAYRSHVQDWLDAADLPQPANQSTACRPVTNQASTQAMLHAVNFARSMAQLDPLDLDPVQSSKTEYRAMMLDLDRTLDPNSLTRTPLCNIGTILRDTDSTLVTDRGPAAAGVLAIMAGHGRPLAEYTFRDIATVLFPNRVNIAAGTAGNYTALDLNTPDSVVPGFPYGEEPARPSLPLLTWPVAGYVPATLVPDVWMLNSINYSYGLGSATLTLQRTDLPDQSASTVSPTIRNDREFTWGMADLPPVPAAGSLDYTLTLSGLTYRGRPVADRTWTVHIFTPPPAAVHATTAPALTGTPRLGSALTARVRWDRRGAATSCQWLRDLRPVIGATRCTFTPTQADIGHRMSVRVTGTRSGFTAASAQSPQTGPVTRKVATLTASVTTTKKRQASFTVRVTAAGEAAVPGTVTITEKGRTKASIALQQGRGTATLKRVPKGTHLYTLTYSGSARNLPTSKTLSSKIR